MDRALIRKPSTYRRPVLPAAQPGIAHVSGHDDFARGHTDAGEPATKKKLVVHCQGIFGAIPADTFEDLASDEGGLVQETSLQPKPGPAAAGSQEAGPCAEIDGESDN